MSKVRIATISYINSTPFVYGIRHAANELSVDLLLHTPSKCVDSLRNGECDIAIVPVAVVPTLKDCKIISNYCISATNDVRTVVLVSNTPINEVKKIYLDEDSRTSAQLVKILARERWHISPEWEQTDVRSASKREIPEGEAYMLIGDKVFEHEGEYKYSYDLAREWHEMTSLPFVFAVWVARDGISPRAVENLNTSLEYGLKCIDETIRENVHSIPYDTAKEYLTKNIEYTLTEDKRRAIELFILKSESAEPSSGKL